MSQRTAEGVTRVLVLSSSPRRDGNSRLLADGALDGVREAGHTAELVHLYDHLGAFLRDCRLCRSAEGHCTIDAGVSREEIKSRYAAGIPVGRVGRPEDIASTVAFLARTGSAALVGQVVQPNGGTTRGGAW